ncbi:MAG: DUF1016 domain-containing protein [Akkermansiaceae bacterium]|nr:DUF1016 domain-containing protein [Akkermansiaceae bacterium]
MDDLIPLLHKLAQGREISGLGLMSSKPKLSAVLRELHPTIGSTFKDSYVLEFLGLPSVHNESDLQTALARQMKQFILELGEDFIFMGDEYRLPVTDQGVVIMDQQVYRAVYDDPYITNIAVFTAPDVDTQQIIDRLQTQELLIQGFAVS